MPQIFPGDTPWLAVVSFIKNKLVKTTAVPDTVEALECPDERQFSLLLDLPDPGLIL